MLEIQGDTTCRSTGKETPLKKQLSSESVNIPQTLDIQHNYIRFQVCLICESIFTSPEEFASHQLNCNFISVSAEPVVTVTPYSKCQSLFPCSCSNKVLTSGLKRDHHLFILTEEPVSKLMLCDKTFQNMELKEHFKHSKVHTGERPYTCDYCDKSFTWKASLSYHVSVHTKECPFVCQMCGKSFRNKQILNSHKETHIEKLLRGCEFCGQLFAQKSTPAAHVKLHLGERPFICE
ncbi:hypothetical protein PR048_025974 [Dryococelus australis]|uniref:C2H2-type domain-containing protein n=1 Tax=Dryococelus australis TaxID=614101 RepID=A0ABQ9GK14_9NEOP|nr:hypothetical protein PR048_025974 [Dryococelus australis]